MGVAAELRAAGVKCDLVLDPGRKTKWAFKYADRLAAKAIVLLAPDEAARCVRVVCVVQSISYTIGAWLVVDLMLTCVFVCARAVCYTLHTNLWPNV